MNPVDIAILIVLVAFVAKGVLRGLLKEVCSLLGLVVGGWLAFAFHVPVSQWLVSSFGLPDKLGVGAAFVALFLGSVILFGALGFVLSRFVSLVFLGGVNRLTGGIFGAIQGVVLLALILFALQSPVGREYIPQAISQAMQRSHLAPPFVELGQAVFDGGRNLFGR